MALVSGAVEGIGWASSQELARSGYHVIVCGRVADERLLNRVKQLQSFGLSAEAVVMDVREPNSVSDAFRKVFTEHKRLDVLVANAGGLGDARLGMISEEVMRSTIETNLLGAIRQIQSASRLMQRQHSGSIIVVGSIMGLRGNIGQAAYSSAKAGLVGLVMSSAKELAPFGVRVNLVAPGFITTRMTEDLSQEVIAERVGSIGMGRAGTPEEVAQVIGFLASDLSSYVTGQVIGVDGGMVV